ncbi:MAG TPA: protease inhibitor I42 family protein [Methylomirabilota bacterium]|nr:protease inhibitor I42 family protein [Methylomirabilota bacterium]
MIVLAGACASTDFGPHGAVMITPENAGRTIELRSGQELLVRLPSNPAMGYRWALAAAPADVLKLEGLPSFERNPNGANRPGAPGFEVWRFTLARKGQQVLTFDYRLPWDGDAPPAQQLSFTVTVR